MKIQDVGYRVSCDIPNCRNEAHIKIEKVGFFKSAGEVENKNINQQLKN